MSQESNPAGRIYAFDLEWAAMWLRAYNDGIATDPQGNPDSTVQTARRVAAWLEAEAARRRDTAELRAVAAELRQRYGSRVSMKTARRARDRIRERATTETSTTETTETQGATS